MKMKPAIPSCKTHLVDTAAYTVVSRYFAPLFCKPKVEWEFTWIFS